MQYLFLFMQSDGAAAATTTSQAPAATQGTTAAAPAAQTATSSEKVDDGKVAPATGRSGFGNFQFLGFMVLIFVVMYFFMIRPQQKRQKEMVKFRNSLEKGQKIVTAGGIYGTIKEIKDGYVMVDIDTNTTIRVDKSMVVRDPSDLQQQR